MFRIVGLRMSVFWATNDVLVRAYLNKLAPYDYAHTNPWNTVARQVGLDHCTKITQICRPTLRIAEAHQSIGCAMYELWSRHPQWQ